MNDIQKDQSAEQEKERLYSQYEKLIIRRDQLKKEAGISEALYYHEFGPIMTDLFHKKLECIQWKKIISYCQAAANTGKRVNEGELDTYISNSMMEYRDQLRELIRRRDQTKKLEESPLFAVEKAKRIYRDIAKLIHPDMHPDLAGNPYFTELWTKAAEAYHRNDVHGLEEVKLLSHTALVRLGKNGAMPRLPDIEERIKSVRDQINRIRSTDPYLFKFLLDDPEAVKDRKKDLNSELGEYTDYGLTLESVLTKMMGKEFTDAWKRKMQME